MPQTISLGTTTDSPNTVNKDVEWIIEKTINLLSRFNEDDPNFSLISTGFDPLKINIIKLKFIDNKIKYYFIHNRIRLSINLIKFICSLDPLMTYKDKFLKAHSNYQAKAETVNALHLPRRSKATIKEYKSKKTLDIGQSIVLSVIGG